MKPDDDRFVKRLLEFINGTLDATWGITVFGIVKGKRKPTEFRMGSDDIKMGIFSHPMIDNVLTFGKYTPVLGNLSEDTVDDLLVDDSVDDSEQNLAFLRMLDSKGV